MNDFPAQHRRQGDGSRGSCPEQPRPIRAVHLDAGYQMTAADCALVRDGRALFFSGRALAKPLLLVDWMPHTEFAWYWLADQAAPEFICDVLLPREQEVSACRVAIAAAAVTAANREARGRGMVVAAAGHSHHDMGAWSSRTDLELMDQLSAEGVGFRSELLLAADGHVELDRGDAESLAPPGGRSRFRVTFPGSPDHEVWITAPAGVPADALEVRRTQVQRRLLSSFATVDSSGQFHFPVYDVVRCGQCGGRMHERFVQPEAVCIVGPVHLSAQEMDDLLVEFRQRLPGMPYGSSRQLDRATAASGTVAKFRPAAGDSVDAAPDRSDAAVGTGFSSSPPPFQVYRRGELLGEIPAAVLEEAAHRVSALAKALRWTGEPNVALLPAPDPADQSQRSIDVQARGHGAGEPRPGDEA